MNRSMFRPDLAILALAFLVRLALGGALGTDGQPAEGAKAVLAVNP